MPHRPHRPPAGVHSDLFASPSDSKPLDEEQNRVLEAMRTGVGNLIDRFFDEARPVVRRAMLRVVLAEYHEGIKRGRAQAVAVYEAYLATLPRLLRPARHDPRAEPVVPRPTLHELHAEAEARGLGLTLAELGKLCAEMRVPLATADDLR